jgi:hypothetical protein
MTDQPIEAFPLQWPPGRPRTKWPERSNFEVTLGKAIRDVQEEVRRLGGAGLVISSNLPLRRDGMPYANSSQPEDRGVAVYFRYKRKPMCFACDRWNRIEDNLRAISKTIDALRGIERWGTGQMVEQAFTGFTALPAPEQPWQVLGLDTSRPTRDQIDEAHRRLAAEHHPDRGGDNEKMARINAARDELYRSLES